MSALRINRYILGEIIVPTILGLVILTFVLLMGRILPLMEMVINKGIPLVEIVRLFLYLLPAFLTITLPLAFLLGTLIGLGRLSADSEIVALKASGFGLMEIARPVLFLSSTICLITAILTLYLEPSGNTAFLDKLFEIAKNRASIGIRPMVFNTEFDSIVLYANGMDDRTGTMNGVLISDERSTSASSTILAEKGRIVSNSDAGIISLRLENGSIHRKPSDKKEGGSYQIVRFANYDINLDMGRDIAAKDRKPKKEKEFSSFELLQAHAEADTPQKKTALSVELQKRIILPLTPFLFALVGIPLGIQSHRSGKGSGFALALLIFLLFYLLFSFAQTLVIEGGIPFTIVLWIPSVLFLFGGIVLLRQATMEKTYAPLAWVIDSLLRILKRV